MYSFVDLRYKFFSSIFHKFCSVLAARRFLAAKDGLKDKELAAVADQRRIRNRSGGHWRRTHKF